MTRTTAAVQAVALDGVFQAPSDSYLSAEQLRELLVPIVQTMGALVGEVRNIRTELVAKVDDLLGRGIGIALSQRNRSGFTKSEAKKLFYSLRGGKPEGEGEGGDEEDPDDPIEAVNKAQTTDQKIEQIIDYMKDTTSKLDRIEDDINFLKEQVDRILKRI